MMISPMIPSQTSGLWHRGGKWKLEERETEWSWTEHPIIPVDWADLKTYDPVTEATQAYLAFAQLRDDLWSDDDPDWQYKVVLEPSGFPAHDPFEQWKRLEGFIEQYGCPLPVANFTLEKAMAEARLMAIAVQCYRVSEANGSHYIPALRRYFSELQQDEISVRNSAIRSFGALGYPGYFSRNLLQVADFSTENGLVKAARAWLEDTIGYSPHSLIGMHERPTYEPDNGWQPKYWYESLSNVMWSQLNQATLKGSPIRQCQGCEKVFEVTMRNTQKFHDPLCRGAANARHSYRRRRERTDERQY